MNVERWTMNNGIINFGFQNSEFGTINSQFEIPRPALLRGRGGRNPQSGMSLIEVILVVVIMGTLAAVVVPRAGFDISTTASVDGAAYMIASDIRYVQEFAMANRVSKTVAFSTATPTVYSFNPVDQLDPSGRLPAGVTIGSNLTVTFNSLGEPIAGGGGSVTVSGNGQTRTITIVNYTGKVNIS
jgi:prepilin-type N-terminal cleavage/methylation domain-containing protein